MAVPDPPACSFASDNTAGVLPEVLDALAAANTPAALAYGDDEWTGRVVERFRELFDAPVEVLLCWGGTGANVVGLASLLQPWQAVICPDSAHIATDECGAPSRFTGSTLLDVPVVDGKLSPEAVRARASGGHGEHQVQPAVVSVSQTTEVGTVYRTDELRALGDTAHELGLRLHVDGARIANAVAATGDDLVTMIRDTGVDVLTFGATKNGAMYGEAVVYLDPSLATHARFVRKQAGQLPSKSRFVAAQLLALLEGDRWVGTAAHANAMAALLADRVRGIAGVEVLGAPEANALFVRLPKAHIEALKDWSFFWDWDVDDGVVRWMTSFVTTVEDVEHFAAGVAAILGGDG